MLRVAYDKGWTLQAPRIKKPRLRMFDADYRYLRDASEIERLLKAALQESNVAYMLYLMAINTGLREGELAGLRWSDIDFSRRLITVQYSFQGPTKNGEVRYVPILDSLLDPLRSWRTTCKAAYVFTNMSGGMLRESARIFQEVLHRVLDRAQFPRLKIKGKSVRYIRFHDLRHTFASHWVMNGGDIFKLQKILGHKSIQMTMRYAHLTPHAFTEDLGRLGQAAPIVRMGSDSRQELRGEVGPQPIIQRPDSNPLPTKVHKKKYRTKSDQS